jgi:hypothetical protein
MTLDEAWAEAEAALPESKPPWMMTLHTYVVDATGEPFVEATACAPMYEEVAQVFGPTPEAALRALAADLRARR